MTQATSPRVDVTLVGTVLDTLAERIAGVGNLPARQEARDLIAAVLDVPRFWPSAHRQHSLTPEQVASIDEGAARLAEGMPFAYAVRRAAFRNLVLYVDERVLIPRSETEMLVDLVLDSTARGRGIAIDVGTGSGCVAIAFATEGNFDRVIGTDISDAALTIARVNGRGNERVEFRSGSFLGPCRDVRASVVVSNPPYIAWGEASELPGLVRDWEPAVSLFADDNGMAAIRAVVHESIPVLLGGGLLAMEVDSRRAEDAAALVRNSNAYRDVVVRADLTGRPRFVLARRSED